MANPRRKRALPETSPATVTILPGAADFIEDQPQNTAPPDFTEYQSRTDYEQASDDSVSIAAAALQDDTDSAARVRAYRRDPEKQSGGAFLFELSPREWLQRGTWSLIQKRYGAGNYEVRIYGKKYNEETDTSKFGIIAIGEQTLEKPLEDTPEPQRLGMVASAPGFEQILQQQNAFMEKMINTLASRSAPAPQAGGTITELITALATLDTLKNKNAAPAFDQFSMMEKILGVINKNRERDITPGANDNDEPRSKSAVGEMLELIKEFKPLIMEGLQRVQQPAQVLPAAPALAAVPGNLEIPANNPATDETGEDMFLNMFVKPQLEKLISAARSNEDVEKHANDVIDITPPAILDDWIDAPQLLETLGAINPGVKNFPDWFTKLFAKIRELTSDDEPAQDTGNNP